MKKILTLIILTILVGLKGYSQSEYYHQVYVAVIATNPLYRGTVRVASPGGVTLEMNTANSSAFVNANVTSGDKFMLYLNVNHPCEMGCRGANHYMVITNSGTYEKKVSVTNNGFFQDMVPFDPSGGLTNLTIYFY